MQIGCQAGNLRAGEVRKALTLHELQSSPLRVEMRQSAPTRIQSELASECQSDSHGSGFTCTRLVFIFRSLKDIRARIRRCRD
jgi:hypothetical protein